MRVEDQRLERRLRIPLRRRNALDHRLQHILHTLAHLRARQDRLIPRQADDLLQLLPGPLGRGVRQIDLVDDGYQFESLLHRQVDVGHRLRLHPRHRVDDEYRPLRRRQAARYLVGEVHVAGSIDQVQQILLAIAGAVHQPDRARLDGDPALPLQVHLVEDLLPHLSILDRVRDLQYPVRKRGLAVVDMRDDAEVPDALLGRQWHSRPLLGGERLVRRPTTAKHLDEARQLRRPE